MEGDPFKETEEQCVHPFRMSIAVLEKQNILCNIFKEMCETLTYISHVKKVDFIVYYVKHWQPVKTTRWLLKCKIIHLT